MSWSYIPRWKLTDSCGRPPVPGGIHVGCTHDGHMQQCHATRRALLKAGVAIVGGAGLATVVGPRERSRPSIKIAGWSRSFSKITSCRLRTGLGSRASTLPASKYSAESSFIHRSAE